MKCVYCQQEIEPGELSVYAPGTCLDRVHTKCRDDKVEADRLKRQEAMENAATVACGKCCPFAPGHPTYTNEGRCITTDCMAWDGYDCRRLQLEEVV